MRVLFLCIFALPAMAGEYAVLSNGFRIHADRHEKSGDIIRLESQSGVIEVPARSIASFEQEEYAPPSAEVAAQVSPPAPAQRTKTPKELVDAAARKAELPSAIVHAVARAESAYRQDAVSPKGAIGIMQLMPGTAKQLQADPNDPQQNAEAGALYLRELLVKYNGDVAKALAAYNAGPGAVDKYGDVPPYRETRSYVNRVIDNYRKLGGE
jgi:soluble lytic murein transglycosylase-like protein